MSKQHSICRKNRSTCSIRQRCFSIVAGVDVGFSPNGFAMLKNLYFTAVVSSSFFLLLFRRLISEVTKQISTKLGHILTYDCYLKNLVRTPSDTCQCWGHKNRFIGTGFERRPNISLQQNMISTIRERKLSIYRDFPTCLSIGPETAENGWRVFAHPYIFSLGDTASPTTWTLCNRQQANWHVLCSGTSLQSRTTECRVGSSLALQCI